MNIKTKLLWQTFFTTATGIAAIAIARECTNLSMHDIGILAVLVACWFEFVHIQGVYWCKKMK